MWTPRLSFVFQLGIGMRTPIQIGVMECWSIGVLVSEFQHHSITPLLHFFRSSFDPVRAVKTTDKADLVELSHYPIVDQLLDLHLVNTWILRPQ
jgi:hypothetical protein